MRDTLTRDDDGTPNFSCKLSLAPGEMITSHVLRENLQELFVNDADVALFYFSGHGTANNLGGYLVTVDAKRYDDGVAMSDVLTLANKAAIREVVIILDCCHSGAFGELPAINNQSALLREGVSVLTASRRSQPSVESAGGGVFTSLVCAALEGGAADVCGNVSVAGVYMYVDQALGAWDQRPLFKAHVSKLISLRRCKPQIEPAILRLLPQYFPAPDHQLALDPSYEPEAKPKDEAHEQIFSHLQKYRDARLLVAVGEDHMYGAAMKSKSCRLTHLGQFYWRLAKSGRL